MARDQSKYKQRTLSFQPAKTLNNSNDTTASPGKVRPKSAEECKKTRATNSKITLCLRRSRESSLIPLEVGSILGRTPNSGLSTGRVDLGLTHENAPNTPRSACRVISLSNTGATIRIEPSFLANHSLCPLYHQPFEKPATAIRTNTCTLNIGDYLIFPHQSGKHHYFKLVQPKHTNRKTFYPIDQDEVSLFPLFLPPSPAKIANRRMLWNDSSACADDGIEDDTTETTEPPQDMHATLANTYWKAMLSDTPNLACSSLLLLLESNRLPTPNLCAQLVQLLLHGPYSGPAGILPLEPSNKGLVEPQPFWEPGRLEHAQEYLRSLFHRFPGLAHERVAQAAGSDFWKNCIDNLFTLAYADSLEDSLRLSVYSLHLLSELLKGLCPRSGTHHPMLQDISSYGSRGRAACKHVAQAMAHVWGTYRHHLVGVEVSPLTSILQSLTEELSQILLCMLDKFVPQEEHAQLLWNSMRSAFALNRIGRSAQAASVSLSREDMEELKISWIGSWGREDLEFGLAKRLDIEDTYMTEWDIPCSSLQEAQ